MRCKKCNARLAEHDLWCVFCGMVSPVIHTELSSMSSMKRTRKALKAKYSEMVPATGFSIIMGVIPIAVLIWVFHNYIHTDGTSQFLLTLMAKALLFSLVAPFMLLPFSRISASDCYELKLSAILAQLKHYPRYFVFSLINAIFFVLIYLICFGFPGFASDPILRLVWIVLLNYWAAIVAPAPVIMERMELNPLKAIALSYRHLHDVRWNTYLLVLVLGILNILAFSLAIFPLLFTLPLSWFAIRDYTIRLEQYELFDYRM